MSRDFKIEHDPAQVRTSLKADIIGLRTMLANELLKDANFYCRKDSGSLISSSIRASRPEAGELVWDTPYAKAVYYTGTPSKDSNQNAELMWAEKAATQDRPKLERMAQAYMKGGGP